MEADIKKMDELRSKGEKLPQAFYKKIKQQAKQFIGTAYVYRQSNNIWDNFKVLVSSRSRYWWTQQWFMGYIAWTLFVGIECKPHQR